MHLLGRKRGLKTSSPGPELLRMLDGGMKGCVGEVSRGVFKERKGEGSVMLESLFLYCRACYCSAVKNSAEVESTQVARIV